ncbi:WS/DGAT domain-containing protein [Aeromicrobium marinum]|uniref:WS/DGAT domain-containing protein n=1 Tax=Aeromicrobium marinum TaxID=219314 RepID=UPI0001BCCB8B|nr:WS/DGAT domain-containing protein [Aeromicrobium marinum]
MGLPSVGALLPGPFSYKLIVSDVPDPTEDSFFLGSRLETMNPASPQLGAAVLNDALLSYAEIC